MPNWDVTLNSKVQSWVEPFRLTTSPRVTRCRLIYDSYSITDYRAKGFFEALEKGTLSGNPIVGCRMVLQDGSYHVVDSSELAFRIATISAFREIYMQTKPIILEPIMTVEVVAPSEFQSAVIGSLNQRRGTILDSEVRDEEFVCTAEVPLSDMFGYSSQLRGVTQGKGEFSMEYRVSTLALFQRTWSLYFFPLDAPARPPECSEGFVRGLPEDVASGKKIE